METLANLYKIQEILDSQSNHLVAFELLSPLAAKLFKANRIVMQRVYFDEVKKEYYFELFFEWVDENTPARFMGERGKRRVYFTKGPLYQKYLETMAQGHPIVLRGEMLEFLKKNTEDVMDDIDFKSALVLPIKGQGNEVWGNISFHSLDDETIYDDLKDFEQVIYLFRRMLESYVLVHKLVNEQADAFIDDDSMRMVSLGKIAAGIAHEINNPMFIIGGFATRIDQIIEDDEFEENKEDIKTFLEMIEKNCKRVTDIIAGLRLMARDASKDDFEVVDARELINQTVEISKERLQLEKINISFECSDDEYLVECKPGQLMQVLSNLISNSSDALVESKAGDWIKITLEKKDSQIIIRVIDAGSNIPEDVAVNIMEPFFTTKEPSKGTGLGLSISKEIVKRFDGELRLDQNFKNTCFVVSLPEISFDEE